jgi:hypothetical protein
VQAAIIIQRAWRTHIRYQRLGIGVTQILERKQLNDLGVSIERQGGPPRQRCRKYHVSCLSAAEVVIGIGGDNDHDDLFDQSMSTT